MLLMLPGVNPNGMKKLLGNGVSTFFISEVQFLIMVQELYQKILLKAFFYTVEFLMILY